jgi:hypothetical protein
MNADISTPASPVAGWPFICVHLRSSAVKNHRSSSAVKKKK